LRTGTAKLKRMREEKGDLGLESIILGIEKGEKLGGREVEVFKRRSSAIVAAVVILVVAGAIVVKPRRRSPNRRLVCLSTPTRLPMKR